jgi:hypothetical protein
MASDYDSFVAEGLARHTKEAASKLDADLSHEVYEGTHFITWHTSAGQEFLDKPSRNLCLWHSMFIAERARTCARRVGDRLSSL